MEFVNEPLREALIAVAGHGSSIGSRTLGNWLCRTQGPNR